jgi:hypothetical protein
LATAATVIASQALISGAFSLTRQAVQLGYMPRVTIVHTSEKNQGQIYIPEVNQALMVACLSLVVVFQESTRLAAAYGIAVTGTMSITSIVYFVVITRNWGWKLSRALPLLLLFLAFDVPFFAAKGGLLLFGCRGHLASDVAAEQVPYLLALAQSGDHRVETTLEFAEFGAVEHHHTGIEITLLNPPQRRPHHPDRSGGQPGQHPHQQEPHDEADDRGDQDRDLQLALGEVTQQQREQCGQADADDRHARTQHPYRQGPAHDARSEPAGRRSDRQGLRRHWAQCKLRGQVARGGHHDATKAHCQCEPWDEVGVVSAKEHRQKDRAASP